MMAFRLIVVGKTSYFRLLSGQFQIADNMKNIFLMQKCHGTMSHDTQHNILCIVNKRILIYNYLIVYCFTFI